MALRPSTIRQALLKRRRRTSVRLGIYGRPHGGKTTLFWLAKWDTLSRNLPSGLEFGVQDPRENNEIKEIADRILQMLRTRGLPATGEMLEQHIDLFDNEDLALTLDSQDSVGQIFVQVKRDSPVDQQQQYEEHVRALSRAHVLWVVLPMPPRSGDEVDQKRYEDDMKTARVYLRESLRQRSPDQTCSVAIVLTKADTFFNTPDEARRVADEDLLDAIQPLVSVARSSDKIQAAACFPVSAMGFGRVVPLDEAAERDITGISGLDEGDQEWVLPVTGVPEPWNVTPLLVYSMMAGLLNVEVDKHQGAELKDLYQRLQSDLAGLDGWMIPVKGEL